MDKDLADFVIKKLLEKGASYAESRLETYESNGFMLKNGNPEISGFGKVTGLGIRYLINNTLGFISVNELNKDNINKLIKSSFLITEKASKIGEKINFSENKTEIQNYKVNQKIKIKDKDPNDKLSILIDLDKQLNQLKGRYLSLSDSIVKKYYVNSEGSKIESEIPRIDLFYFLTLVEGKKSIQRYLDFGSSSGYECLKKWNYESNILNEVKQLTKNLKEGIKPPKGVVDVITAPEVTGIAVHESVGHPYEADRIFGREAAQAGESFVDVNMLNTKIGSDVVNIVDDPTLDNSYGFFLYDDEGVKAREKVLIKKGIINEFLHNRETAKRMNILSNASSRANSYDVEPIIRMSNTFMKPGSYSEEELIEDVKLGVYIKNFMEWNIDDKRYHQKYVGNEAYLIKNGRIEEPVRSPALEITTPGLWSSVDAAGKEVKHFAGNCGKGEPMQGIPVWMGGPSIRIRNVRVY